ARGARRARDRGHEPRHAGSLAPAGSAHRPAGGRPDDGQRPAGLERPGTARGRVPGGGADRAGLPVRAAARLRGDDRACEPPRPVLHRREHRSRRDHGAAALRPLPRRRLQRGARAAPRRRPAAAAVVSMTTVRDAAFELFRAHGMTTIFGNPGSTELPMLGPFPEDFRYILGLQEAVAVGMADGFAQASGRVTHVNLHTAPGLGNGVGAILGARANKAPLLVTAGQQVRSLITMQALLTNRDAVVVPKPYVKWSFEPPRAED